MKTEVILGRFFISLISFILMFLLVDFLSIFLFTSRSPIESKFPVQDYRYPKPYVMFGGKPNSDYEGINRMGYRGTLPLMPKNNDEFRVIMLGGSTVVRGYPPIPELLENKFAHNNVNHVKIYNYGVVSSVSSMDLARIVFEVMKLEPDLIIFYNGGNDILSPWSYDPRPGYPLNFIAYQKNPLLESDVKTYPSIAMFAYGSNILRHFFPSFFVRHFISLEEVRAEAGWKTEDWKEKVADIYIDNIIKADKISKSFGARFITFFQPLIYYKSHLTNEEKRHALDDEEKKYALDMRKRIVDKIENVKKQHQLKVIDLSLIYKDFTEEVFGDEIHTHQSAKSVVVQEIYKHILNNNLVKKKNNAE